MRAFFAIELPQEVSREAARAGKDLSQRVPAFRVPQTENLHLTLAFLGEISDAKIPALTSEAARALQGCKPFAFALRGAGHFPPAGKPRVVWLGAARGASECAEVARRVLSACKAVGASPDDKPFHAHVTIGRLREGARPMAYSGLAEWEQDHSQLACGDEFTVDRIVLFESTLTPHGPVYRARSVLEFGA